MVPLCATRQTKVDFKRPTGQKEAQKFTFAYCLRARGKNVTYLHQFHKVPVATESSSLRNLPALALFPRAPLLRVLTDDTRLCWMYNSTNDSAIQRGWENVSSPSIPGNAANNSNRFLASDAAVVSLRSYHYFKWTSYLPCLVAYPLRRRFFSLIFLSWKPTQRNARESLFVLSRIFLSSQQGTNVIFPTIQFTRTNFTSNWRDWI